MSPRWFDGKDHLALDTGGGPIARLWSTALSGLVDIGYVKATGTSVQINLPKTALKGPVSFEWKIPKWSNTIERNRARTYFQAYAAGVRAALRREGAGGDPRRPDQDVGDVQGAGRGDRLRLHRGGARRALAPHGDPRRQDRQLPPVPADAVERQPARQLRHARARTRTRCRASRSSRRTTGRTSRASTSCARCAASIPACRAACTCTSASGKTLEKLHSPTQSVTGDVSRQRHGAARRRSTELRSGGDRIEALLEASSARRRRSPASGPRSWCAWSSTSTAPGWSGCCEILDDAGASIDGCWTRWRPTSWCRACCSCTACTPTPVETRVERALDAGAALPGLARRRRRAARGRRRRASCGCGCSAAATAARRRR